MNTELQKQIAERKVQADERGIASSAVHVAAQMGDTVKVEPTITDLGGGEQLMTPAPGVFKVYCDGTRADPATHRPLTIMFHEGDKVDDPGPWKHRHTVHILLGAVAVGGPRVLTAALGALLEDDNDVVFVWRGWAYDLPVRAVPVHGSNLGVLGYIPGPWETRLSQLALYANEEKDKSTFMAEQAEEAAARKAWGLAKPTFEG